MLIHYSGQTFQFIWDSEDSTWQLLGYDNGNLMESGRIPAGSMAQAYCDAMAWLRASCN